MAKYDIVQINDRIDFFPSGISDYATNANLTITQDEDSKTVTLTAASTTESTTSGVVLVKTFANPIPAEHFCFIMFEFEHPSTNVTGIPICWLGLTSDGTTVDSWHEPIPTSTLSYNKDTMQGLCIIKGYTKQILQVGIGLRGATQGDYVKIKRVAIIDETEIFGTDNERGTMWCLEHFTFNTTLKSFSFANGCLEKGDTIECPYSGAAQSTKLPTGNYKLECWGAQGGQGYYNAAAGGKGGYSVGVLNLPFPSITYLYAGGAGTYNSSTNSYAAGGFGGGGAAGYRYGGSGGGGSDIRFGTDSLYARAIVAGGGGGAFGYNSANYACGGVGGGVSGGYGNSINANYRATPGTQTAGGTAKGYNTSYIGTNGSFGLGGNANVYANTYDRAGGGGGGWYGGAGGAYRKSSSYYYYPGGAPGGSGYVYDLTNAANYPSGCLLNENYYLSNCDTLAGNVSFIDYNGATVTGHSGDGAVRITALRMPGDIEGETFFNNASLMKMYIGSDIIEKIYKGDQQIL